MCYKVTFTPNKNDLTAIIRWLYSGMFYGDRFNIEEGYKNQELAIITSKEEIIGYLLYKEESQHTIYIRIAEIRPDFKNKKAGKVLVKSCIDKFIQEGKSTIYLKSVFDSEPFWKKMGFNHRFQRESTEDKDFYLKMNLID